MPLSRGNYSLFRELLDLNAEYLERGTLQYKTSCQSRWRLGGVGGGGGWSGFLVTFPVLASRRTPHPQVTAALPRGVENGEEEGKVMREDRPSSPGRERTNPGKKKKSPFLFFSCSLSLRFFFLFCLYGRSLLKDSWFPRRGLADGAGRNHI